MKQTLRRKTPMRRISLKKARTSAARRRAVLAARKRDGGCILREEGGCWGPWDGHEPDLRWHGTDTTDPDNIVTLCRGHHQRVHANPAESYARGLLVRSRSERVLVPSRSSALSSVAAPQVRRSLAAPETGRADQPEKPERSTGCETQ